MKTPLLRLQTATASTILLGALCGFGQSASPVVSPSETSVMNYLKRRIQNESNGRITLHVFQAKVDRLEGSDACSTYFFAEVYFLQPAIWRFRSKDSPLSFETSDLQTGRRSPGTDTQDMVEVARRGQGFSFSGDLIFRREAGVWVFTEIKMKFYPRQKGRMDFALTSCTSNLKEIAHTLRFWAEKHDNSYAFNLSTNVGGTKELCTIGAGGFDHYPGIHFRAMADSGLNPRSLICAADLRIAAAGIASLQDTNISYRLRTDPAVSLTHPAEVICACPVHHVTVNCSGQLNFLKPPND